MKVLSENLHILRSTYAEYEMKGLNEAHGAVLKTTKKKKNYERGRKVHSVLRRWRNRESSHLDD